MPSRKAPKSAAERAGLLFPIPRIKNYIKRRTGGKRGIDSQIPIYLAAVQQQITEIILRASAEHTKKPNSTINWEAFGNAMKDGNMHLGKITQDVYFADMTARKRTRAPPKKISLPNAKPKAKAAKKKGPTPKSKPKPKKKAAKKSRKN